MKFEIKKQIDIIKLNFEAAMNNKLNKNGLSSSNHSSEGGLDDFRKLEGMGEVAAQDREGGSNGVTATSLAIISCIMGGGIVSIPFAYAVEGIYVGITVQVMVIAAIFISCRLYLSARTMLSCRTDFGEIAEKCLGPVSGIILNSLLVFCIFGIMALYMTLFAQIFISLLGSDQG